MCVIGATNVLGEVLLAELYCRITQGRSLHSSLPTPIPKLVYLPSIYNAIFGRGCDSI